MKALMLKKQDKIYAPVHFHHSALKAEPVRGKKKLFMIVCIAKKSKKF